MSNDVNNQQGLRNFLLLLLVIIVVGVIIMLLLYFLTPTKAPVVQSSTQPVPVKSNEVTASASHEPLGGQYYYAGMPKPTASIAYPITVLTNIGYVVGYSESMKDPVWTCYRLRKVSSLVAPPRPKQFNVDNRTRARVTTHDYTGSGYDRGHGAPNYAIAVCFGASAQLETFLMSNILPQAPKLNRQVWEELESREIRIYAQEYGALWVITGPVFGKPIKTLPAGVAIPEKFYKIMVREEHGSIKVLAFVIPQTVNGTEPPGSFLCNVDEVEVETRLDFLSALPDDLETKVEMELPSRIW